MFIGAKNALDKLGVEKLNTDFMLTALLRQVLWFL
jgi:hypothetical protein